jgi:hypothetical protein
MSINSSEARLGELTRKTFLSMWAYQNPYFAKGKELCDVLIVFGDDVIIMSDKLISFGDKEIKIAWPRWYKNAVTKSVNQLCGAFRQIKNFPENIYCDSQTSSPFPLQLPESSRMRVHLIAVANGCEDICKQSLGHPSFCVDTRVTESETSMTVGIDYAGIFVHVLSKTALDAMFACFDTTRDFIDYLERKQGALSSKKENFLIHGEEELVGAYMLSQQGNRAYNIPQNAFPLENSTYIVGSGLWDACMTHQMQQARENMRKSSYVIDRLIEHVAEEYTKKGLVIGQEQPLSYHEGAFRLMAAESRLGRQLISIALLDVINEDPTTFWSTIVESPDVQGLIYLWLIYPQIPEEVSEDELEEVLLNELSKYILVAQGKFRKATRIFGICLPNNKSNRTSRIFRVSGNEIWSDEMQILANELEEKEGILANIKSTKHFSSRL